MNSQHKAIRAMLQSMSPRRAKELIKSLQLRPLEESVLVECDVNGLSYVQVSHKLHLSTDEIKRHKQRAYAKIADELNYQKE